jgi:4'-phosphopantetheinyl transferase
VRGEWERAPARLRLPPACVHVWRADLDERSESAAALARLLTRAERERAEHILGERERERWTRSRGLLRELLGRYAGADPRTLRFRAGAHGKPALRRGPGAPAFNVSHSGATMLLAFSRAGPVGVDVEAADRRRAGRSRDPAALAARAFGAEAAERLQALAPAARERELLRLWTRHEAQLKRRGSGIGAGLARGAPKGGWVAELDLGPRLAGAVALASEPRSLRLLRWRA